MKAINLIFKFCLIISFLVHTPLTAQQEETKETRVSITKKTVDENGETTVEKQTLTGIKAEEYLKNQELNRNNNIESEELDIEINTTKRIRTEEKEVEIWINEDGEEHTIEDSGKVMFFDGTEEIPDDVKLMLKEKGIDIDNIENENEDSEQKMYKVISIEKDGTQKQIEWDGNGEMPSEMKEIMEKDGRSDHKSKKIKVKVKVKEEKQVKESKSKPERIIKIRKKSNNKIEEEIFILDEGEELSEEMQKVLKDAGIDSEMDRNDGNVTISIDNSNNDSDVKVIMIEEDLHEHKNENKAQLGVIIEEDSNGVKILDFVKNSAAKESGLKEGDIIVFIDNNKTLSPSELINTLSIKKPGDKISLKVLRGGEFIKFDVKLKGPNVKSALMEKEFNTKVDLFRDYKRRTYDPRKNGC